MEVGMVPSSEGRYASMDNCDEAPSFAIYGTSSHLSTETYRPLDDKTIPTIDAGVTNFLGSIPPGYELRICTEAPGAHHTEMKKKIWYTLPKRRRPNAIPIPKRHARLQPKVLFT
jgi:hypothetical protein